MNRETRCDLVLRHLMSGGAPEPVLPATRDSFDHGLDALVHLWAGRYERAASSARDALAQAADADALALARAVSGLAIGGWPEAAHDEALTVDPRTGGDPLLAAIADDEPLTPALAVPLRGLLAEAALGCARVDVAVALAELAGPVTAILFGAKHPFLTFVRATYSRIAAFHGDIDSAQRLSAEASRRAESPVESLFALACSALVSGNADERPDARALIKKVSAAPAPRDAVTRGCFVLAAYGAIALGDVERSSTLVLKAGGDADLSHLRIIDRAIGLEMLVAAAIAAEDLDSAESWLSRMIPLATHRIAAPTFERATSRVMVLSGDPAGAVVHAERAIKLATAEGRAIEAAEAEIVLARARIAADQRGEAARGLAEVASGARLRGHLAVQRAAARELRQVGRRLPPIAASGWEGLSPREREVALLMAAGQSNGTLAKELFLSEHTVRIHVSRVLQAFGVATRSGVAAALAPPFGTGPGGDYSAGPLPDLTERQRQVVMLLVEGAPNKAIAQQLGISAATVEKHVSAVLQRWSVTSRSGIVALAGASPEPREG